MADEYYESGTHYGDTESDESVVMVVKTARNIVYIKRDPDATKIRRPIPPEMRHMYEEDKNAVTVQVYETNTTPQYRIRNAITGLHYPRYRVGTLDENRFFKVCWATGHEGRQSPFILFFSTPEDFEKHMLTTVSTEVKQEWRMRQMAELRKEKRFRDVEDDDAVLQVVNKETRRVVIVK